MKKLLSILLACMMLLSCVAMAEGATLRMATGYNSTKTGIAFDAETAGSGVTLADGNTYNTGDLKPTWVELENILGVKFEDKYQGNGANKEFEFWKDRLNEVDMISGTAATLSEYGEAGSLVNLAEHMDKLPNFQAYLDANPIVRLSITGNTSTGAIYFSPYFDGVNDIERMPLMRVDWVQKLLDGEGAFAADACNDLAPVVCEPYMPTGGTVEIETVTADGTGTEIVTKNYDAFGNVVAIMNDAGPLTGVQAVNLLRDSTSTRPMADTTAPSAPTCSWARTPPGTPTRWWPCCAAWSPIPRPSTAPIPCRACSPARRPTTSAAWI